MTREHPRMDQTTAIAPRRALEYDGDIGELYGIFLINMVLSVITLGIYRSWATTRYRRYMWSHLRFEGERFEYTGRGGELFLGFLLALVILSGLGTATALLSYLLAKIHPALTTLPMLALYVTIFILAFAARFSAQRYRLSRTMWCGIRGGMQGSALRYGLRSFLYAMMLPFTLFQLFPWTQVRLAEYRINASRFGSAVFAFRGRAGQLYLPFLAMCLGVLLLMLALTGAIVWDVARSPLMQLLSAGTKDPRWIHQVQHEMQPIFAGVVLFTVGSGLISCWYWALLGRHIVGNTTLGPLAFSSLVTGPSLLWLMLSNMLIAVVTLGFGLPIVMQRSARYLARTLLVSGTLDEATLRQSSLAMPRTGEGMLQMLDHGSIF